MKYHGKRTILYQPICRLCHYVVRSTLDAVLAKQFMEDHLVKSHKFPSHYDVDITLPPISYFAKHFKVIRTVNPTKMEIMQLRFAEQQPQFAHGDFSINPQRLQATH